ncbi:MAG: multicopper oxidase domain-containing protein, partial [Thermodesulfovibrionales bacterium]
MARIRSPLKHTADVPPMGTVVMEFEVNEEKDWFFH